MKARLIVNPVSGDENAMERLPRVNERLMKYFSDVSIVLTTGAGDAERAAATAIADRVEYLFSGGGDGTLNEVLNGAISAGATSSNMTFGVIPFGTGNDFAAALGLPPDPEEVIDLYARNTKLHVDLGRANGRYFVNVSAGGFIAEVSEAVNNDLKSIAGRMAYVLGGARVLKDYEPVITDLTWRAENRMEHRKMPLQLFAVCNGPLVGGGRPIAPLATINDGSFDVCLVESVSSLEFLGLALQIRNGEHLDDPRVAYFKTSDITMRFQQKTKVNTDGEVLEATECRYELIPSAVQFLANV